MSVRSRSTRHARPRAPVPTVAPTGEAPTRSSPGAPSPGERTTTPGESSSISAWLGMFVGLLRLPPAERESIRDELDHHLRERVRALVIEGAHEAEAVRRAVGELGEAAALARRFARAGRWSRTRSRMMNFTMLGMSGAALVMGVVAVSAPSGDEPVTSTGGVRVFSLSEERETGLAQPMPEGLAVDGQPLIEVLRMLGTRLGKPIRVNWLEMEREGIVRDMGITVESQGPEGTDVLRDVLSGIEAASSINLDYRVKERWIEIGPRDAIDRREVMLVSYSLARVWEAGVEVEALQGLITGLVEPHGWKDNGGDLAEMYVVGQKMFVKAPKRYQAQVEWLLAEVVSDAGKAMDADEGAGAADFKNDADPIGVRVYLLKSTCATEMADTLQTVLDAGAGWAEGGGGARIIANASTNAVVVAAPDAGHRAAETLIGLLDRPAAAPDEAATGTAK